MVTTVMVSDHGLLESSKPSGLAGQCRKALAVSACGLPAQPTKGLAIAITGREGTIAPLSDLFPSAFMQTLGGFVARWLEVLY